MWCNLGGFHGQFLSLEDLDFIIPDCLYITLKSTYLMRHRNCLCLENHETLHLRQTNDINFSMLITILQGP